MVATQLDTLDADAEERVIFELFRGGASELDKAAVTLALSKLHLSPRRIDEIFERADTNHDGSLSFSEFKEFLDAHEASLRSAFKAIDVTCMRSHGRQLRAGAMLTLSRRASRVAGGRKRRDFARRDRFAPHAHEPPLLACACVASLRRDGSQPRRQGTLHATARVMRRPAPSDSVHTRQPWRDATAMAQRA
jgi:hypothetical protein